MKNGMLIMFAIRCIAAPNVADTCNTIKYAITIKNEPIIRPVVYRVISIEFLHSLLHPCTHTCQYVPCPYPLAIDSNIVYD